MGSGVGSRGDGRTPASVNTIVTRLPARLLIDLPNWLGDIVHAVPALLSLVAANQRGETTVLLPPAYTGLLTGLGVTTVARPPRAALGWARDELAGRFDVAVTARHSTRAKLLLAGSRARLVLASAGRGAALLRLGTFSVDRARHQRHDLDGALLALGVPAVADGPMCLPLDGMTVMGPRIRQALVGHRQPLVALLPATRFLTAKRYPAEAYGATGRTLQERGIATLVVVGPGEEELGRRVAGAAGSALVPGTWPLTDVAALLAACDAAVGNDSGLAHLAAAVGCPTLALFGPTDPARTAPIGRGRFLCAAAPGGWPTPAVVAEVVADLLAGGGDAEVSHACPSPQRPEPCLSTPLPSARSGGP
jgi:ADP-heptose:LPS heptosyltransferase